MKKFLFFGLVAFACLLASCTQSPESISERTIKNAVQEELEQNMLDQSYTTLRVGYFECKYESDRIILAKLAAAGVITYEVERYAWWNKYLQVGNLWGNYYGTKEYFFEEHFMVNVELTEAGKKMVVDTIPLPQERIDEDMKQPEINLEKFPEFNYERENWPEIPNPEAADERPEAPAQEEQEVPELSSRSYANLNNIFDKKETETPQNDENMREALLSLDVETQTQYLAAKEKEHTTDVVLKSSALKVDGVRFIQTYIDQETGLARATAEVIVKTIDVTSAGRILDDKYEGTKLCAPVEFMYYDDKGWVLQSHDIRFSATSEIAEKYLKREVNADDGDLANTRKDEAIKDMVDTLVDDALDEPW